MDEMGNSAAGSLLRSKLTPPQFGAEHLLRTYIEAALTANAHVRLVLFCAPIGYGKTSALAQHAASAQSRGCAVAWLSVEASDAPPALFLQQLFAAFNAIDPSIGRSAQARLAQEPTTGANELIESLLVDIYNYQAPILLVLDDIDHLRCPALLASLNRMVLLAPISLTLAIGSRSRPGLNLATLRAKGLLLEIGSQELNLTRDETRAFLTRAGLLCTEPVLDIVYTRTEGWLMGVQTLAVWLGHQPANDLLRVLQQATELRCINEYLQRNLFNMLSAERQAQLLALGVTKQINGDLANALVGGEDGQQLLEDLEAQQLFLLPLDRERKWYRFHPLFAQFLQAQVRAQNPERLKQLHFNTSLWFTNHHMQNLALEHAAQAEDAELLAALLDACALELINRGQLHLVYKWRKQVPDSVAERFPVLVMADVWTRANEVGLSEANRLLDGLLARWSKPPSSALNDQVLATLTIKAVIALQKDDLESCVTLARRVEAQLGQHNAFLEVATLALGALAFVVLGQPEAAQKMLALAQQRNHFLDGGYLDMQIANVEVLLCLEQGQSKRANLLFSRLRQRFTPMFSAHSRARVLPTITEALIDYSQGRFDGVPDRLRAALDKVDVVNPIDLSAQAMLCLARVQRIHDAGREAAATLVLMQNLAARYQSWRFYVLAVAEEIVLILQEPATDRTKRAEQRLKSVDWAKFAAIYKHRAFNPVQWVLGLTRIRLQQARGHYSEALHEATQLRALLSDTAHAPQHLRLDLLSALSYQRLGYQERAQTLLVQCLVAAEREELRCVFIEEGEAIRQMLQQLESAERQPALQAFLRSVLGAWPGRDAQMLSEVLEEGLTEREREVVCLAAQGLSNEEIGLQLSLALGTVKWHLHNIYEKLKVRNRTQAIRRARELSLLQS